MERPFIFNRVSRRLSGKVINNFKLVGQSGEMVIQFRQEDVEPIYIGDYTS